MLGAALPQAGAQEYLPLILEPGQRQAFNFYVFPQRESLVEELLHLKVLDEQLPVPGADGRTRTLQKSYKWSCPFEISTVQQLSLKIVAGELDPTSVQLASKVPDVGRREELMKQLHAPRYLKVICKTDLGGDIMQGSLFAVIRDVHEDQCEYFVRNESKRFSLRYQQHILPGQLP